MIGDSVGKCFAGSNRGSDGSSESGGVSDVTVDSGLCGTDSGMLGCGNYKKKFQIMSKKLSLVIIYQVDAMIHHSA
jgi:hypothetical protein